MKALRRAPPISTITFEEVDLGRVAGAMHERDESLPFLSATLPQVVADGRDADMEPLLEELLVQERTGQPLLDRSAAGPLLQNLVQPRPDELEDGARPRPRLPPDGL